MFKKERKMGCVEQFARSATCLAVMLRAPSSRAISKATSRIICFVMLSFLAIVIPPTKKQALKTHLKASVL
jgi:hypothetical protein